MGTDCAPLLANLYLHFYEYNFLKKLINENIKQAKKFKNTFRYIDDLATINNPEFKELITKIYPSSLKLNKENDGNTTANYLDTKVTINQSRFIINVYDKRDD